MSAEVAAALNISQGLATSYLYYSRVMRTRLPRVGALLRAGDISYQLFQTIVYRTDLITDPDVMAAVDAELAVKVPRWPVMTQGRLRATGTGSSRVPTVTRYDADTNVSRIASFRSGIAVTA